MQKLLRNRTSDEYVDWVKWRETVNSQLTQLLRDQAQDIAVHLVVNKAVEEKFNIIFSKQSKQDKLLYMILGGIVVANAILVLAIEVFKIKG